MPVEVHHGDCLEMIKQIPDCSISAVICDPPYGLSQHTQDDIVRCLTAWLAGDKYEHGKAGFMGKMWDQFCPGPEVWRECLRVLSPGGHLLAFAGTRSMDLMSMAVRLAGFELRDSIGFANDGGGAPVLAWCYGQGFPKSLDVSKAIDKMAGAEREVVGFKASNRPNVVGREPGGSMGGGVYTERVETAPATDEARRWEGWRSALKPAWEPIILARKPLIGTIAENVLAHGTGALNIDGCRVATEEVGTPRNDARTDRENWRMGGSSSGSGAACALGRFPANVIHDGSDEVMDAFAAYGSAGGGDKRGPCTGRRPGGFADVGADAGDAEPNGAVYADTGTAARFFYSAKASKGDRTGSKHPTIKPVALMRYLVRLVTPPGGMVLDPFGGSGTTGQAALEEGFDAILIEREAEYVDDIRRRIALTEERLVAKALEETAASAQLAMFGATA